MEKMQGLFIFFAFIFNALCDSRELLPPISSGYGAEQKKERPCVAALWR